MKHPPTLVLTFLAFAAGLCLSHAEQPPTVHIRWLRTDTKTGDSLVRTIGEGALGADALDAKISQLVKSAKITELATFREKCEPGAPMKLSAAPGSAPLVIEVETTVSTGGLVHLRYAAEWSPKTPKGVGLARINSCMTLSGDRWHVLGRWNDTNADAILLARGIRETDKADAGDAEQRKQPALLPAVAVHVSAEWMEVDRADLEKASQASSGTRAKALLWLRGRGTVLGSVSGAGMSAQRTILDFFWGGKTDEELEKEAARKGDEDPKEPPPRPGVTLGWESGIVGADNPAASVTPSMSPEEAVKAVDRKILGAEISLSLRAGYVPLKAAGKQPAWAYDHRGKHESGAPELVLPSVMPSKGSRVVVILLTPSLDIVR